MVACLISPWDCQINLEIMQLSVLQIAATPFTRMLSSPCVDIRKQTNAPSEYQSCHPSSNCLLDLQLNFVHRLVPVDIVLTRCGKMLQLQNLMLAMVIRCIHLPSSDGWCLLLLQPDIPLPVGAPSDRRCTVVFHQSRVENISAP